MVSNISLYLRLNYCIQLNGYHRNVVVVAAKTTTVCSVSMFIINIVLNIMYNI